MSTEDILRRLADVKDVHAILALRKYAIRHSDQLLLEYTTSVARAQSQELERELELWEHCFLKAEGGGPCLILVDYSNGKKIPIIKAIRRITRLGLKESKTLADRIPSVLVAEALQEDLVKAAKRLILQADPRAKVLWTDLQSAEIQTKKEIFTDYAATHICTEVL